MFIPRKISKARTAQLNAMDEVQDLKARGWRFYAVNQSCGTCYGGRNVITIPVWAFHETNDGTPSDDYIFYYLAHEMAHAYVEEDYYPYSAKLKPHGTEFMECFKILCPEHLWHYETRYKPRNAKAAGIRSKS